MITVTQFNVIQLKAAQAIIAKARARNGASAEMTAPRDSATPSTPPVGDDPAAEPDVTAQDAPSAEVPTDVQPAQPAPAAEAASPDAAQTAPAEELTAVLATELKLDEKKATYLAPILKAVGNRLDRIRQVRVVQSEGAPADAVQLGDVAYIVDPVAGAPRPVGGRADRAGRGGKRRGDRKGGPGGPGGDRRGSAAGRDGGRKERPRGRSGPGGPSRPSP